MNTGSLKKELNRYNWIKQIGFVDEIQNEFLSSAIILVPTPIPLGFRVRIAEAFSYGCFVIAHKNNALGMPELINGENVILADSGQEFTRAIKLYLETQIYDVLLAEQARKTFEEKYDSLIVTEKLLDYCLH